MQAAPVQNSQAGPGANAGIEGGRGPFSGRKSARKGANGAFAAFFARFQSADKAGGSAQAARDGKAARPERAASRAPRSFAETPQGESPHEAARLRPAKAELSPAREADALDPSAADGAKSVERDAKASRIRARELKPDGALEGAAAALQGAALPKPEAAASAQARKESTEEPSAGTIEEGSRKRGKTRRDESSGPELRVVDLRLKLEAPSAPDAQHGPRDGGGEFSTLQGRAEGAGEGSGKADAPSGMEAARGKSFTEVLAARLGSEGAVDIVKAAQIVLKDGDSGLIRLRLEPESLGGVKIELRLAEKSIEGRILVESEEAKAAFEKALDGLKDAFAREGFESSSLEVSVGSEGREGNPGAGPGEDSGPFWSERLSSFDRAVPTERAIEARRAEGRVDILA